MPGTSPEGPGAECRLHIYSTGGEPAAGGSEDKELAGMAIRKLTASPSKFIASTVTMMHRPGV